MTEKEFRALALAHPGAIEKTHMNHPDFRFGGRVFASLGSPDVGWAMVKLTPAQQAAMIKRAPKSTRPANGAWGAQGCTSIFLADAAPEDALRSAVDEAARPKRTVRATKR
jgi:hypothetical protein